MKVKLKNGFLVFVNVLGVVVIMYIGSHLLFGIESFYENVGDKIPLLGRLFDWAERVLN